MNAPGAKRAAHAPEKRGERVGEVALGSKRLGVSVEEGGEGVEGVGEGGEQEEQIGGNGNGGNGIGIGVPGVVVEDLCEGRYEVRGFGERVRVRELREKGEGAGEGSEGGGRVVEGEGRGIGEERVEFGGGEERGEGGEEELEGEEGGRGREGREREQGFGGGEDVLRVIAVVVVVEEWVEIDEENDALGVGVTRHWI